jgi:N-acetyl-1-D-myo-inositol-2-amino-2-deoxy-alpha-D-glucopyranoside deacetylase/mycothiol S-conjugate amidase
MVALAHPDDESFGMGGTLAFYAEKGVEVQLVCATRGEAGTVDQEYLEGYESIAALREAELRCAAKALGLAGVAFLDYRDSGMEGTKENQHPDAFVNAPLDEVTERLVALMRQLRPQVVLTFDPMGGYHHPDHIAIHKAATSAFHAAGDAKQFPKSGKAHRPELLYYMARSRRQLRWLVRVMPLLGKDPSRVGRNRDIDLRRLARDPDTPPHVTINYKSVEARKRAADACHASQLGGIPRFSVLDVYYRLMGRSDHFTRAHPPAPDDYRTTDLFAD